MVSRISFQHVFRMILAWTALDLNALGFYVSVLISSRRGLGGDQSRSARRRLLALFRKWQKMAALAQQVHWMCGR
jgi:hypothetical protein